MSFLKLLDLDFSVKSAILEYWKTFDDNKIAFNLDVVAEPLDIDGQSWSPHATIEYHLTKVEEIEGITSVPTFSQIDSIGCEEQAFSRSCRDL